MACWLREILYKSACRLSMKSEKELHQMNPAELGDLFPIIINDYNENWPYLFEEEKNKICSWFKDAEIMGVEHVGSTAVIGLKAKPTIDILLEVSEQTKDEQIVQQLKSFGYLFIEQPENPPPGMMFVKGYTTQGFKGQAFHVHVRYPGDWDEIYFRDYLRDNSNAARDYETLKLLLAEKYKNDRDGYTDAKTDFIKEIVKRARGI